MAESRLDQALRQPDFIDAVRRDVQRLLAHQGAVVNAIRNPRGAFQLILERPELRVLGFVAGLNSSEQARFWTLLPLSHVHREALTHLAHEVSQSTTLYTAMARAWPNWVTGVNVDKPLQLLADAPVAQLDDPLESLRAFATDVARMLQMPVPLLITGHRGAGKSSVLLYLHGQRHEAMLFDAQQYDQPAEAFRQILTTGESATRGGFLFVDGLDRCTTEVVAGALALIWANRRGPFQFVVAGQRESFLGALAKGHPHLAPADLEHRFNEIFPLQPRVPRLLADEVEAFVRLCHSRTSLADTHLAPLAEAFREPEFFNPGLVKRCIHRFQLFYDLGGFSAGPVDDLALARWLAARSRWPEARLIVGLPHSPSPSFGQFPDAGKLSANEAVGLRGWLFRTEILRIRVDALPDYQYELAPGPQYDLYGHIEDQLSRRGL